MTKCEFNWLLILHGAQEFNKLNQQATLVATYTDFCVILFFLAATKILSAYCTGTDTSFQIKINNYGNWL